MGTISWGRSVRATTSLVVGVAVNGVATCAKLAELRAKGMEGRVTKDCIQAQREDIDVHGRDSPPLPCPARTAVTNEQLAKVQRQIGELTQELSMQLR